VTWLGLALALASAILVNLALYVEHRASNRAGTLSLRRPLASLWLLVSDPVWFAGYAAGWAGWGLYVAAAGIGVLALLVSRVGRLRLRPAEQIAVWVSLAALVVIAATAGLHPSAAHRQGAAAVLVAIGVILVIGGFVALGAARLSNWGSALGALAGICYAAGDVATKAAVDRDGWVFVVLLLAANVLAFVVLQLSFQRGSALGTAGVATVLTNALPIAAALAVFGEGVPPGVAGGLRVAALVAAIAAAGVLAASPPAQRAPARPAPAPTVPVGVAGAESGASREEWT
jgi:hypothetical protein